MDQVPASRAFGAVEFAENSEPRVPCVLLLDTSASMQGARIGALNTGLKSYRDELLKDSLASQRVEVAIVQFGGSVRQVADFATAENFKPPTLEPGGGTPMGAAIKTGLDMVEKRKATYRENGIPYYRPWLFLITDGEPTDDWKAAIEPVHEGENAKAFCLFGVAVEGANMEVLEKICVRKPLWLEGLKFREMFSWLSNSQQAVSRSSPGEEVPLSDPTSGPKGWARV